MIRKKKFYLRPRKAYESSRIAEENELMKKYALKNKREIWKTIAKVHYFRHRAKALAKSSIEEQQILFNKLKEIGLKIETIADVLDLKVEDVLERRLSTVVFKKNLSKTPQQARQLIVHKKILIDNKIVNKPSYLVHVSEEKTIALKEKKIKNSLPQPAQESQPAKVIEGEAQ